MGPFIIPLEASAINFTLAVLAEIIAFINILILSIWGWKEYLKSPKPLKRLVIIVSTGYVFVMFFMMGPKFALLVNLITEENILATSEWISGLFILGILGIFWELIVQVFFKEDMKKRNRMIYLIPLGILFVLDIFRLIPYEIFAPTLLIMSLILYGTLILKAKQLREQLEDPIEKVRVSLLYWFGIIMILSYMLSIGQGLLQQTIEGAAFSPIHSFAALFGAIALATFVLAFFQPPWLLGRMINEQDLPPIDLKLYPVEFDDEMAKLTDDDMKPDIHFTEWWYFDFEDFNTNAKIVGILKRADTTLFPGFGGVHLEWTSPTGVSKKIYKKFPHNLFKANNDHQTIRIEIGPDNYMEISHGKNATFGKIHLHIMIGDALIDLNANAIAPGIKIGSKGRYYVSKLNPEIYSGASLSVPLFSGKADVKYGTEQYVMNCSGYHDHVFSTTDFLDTHRKWYWARAHFEDAYLMYGDVYPQNLYYGKMKYLYILPKLNGEPIYDHDFEIEAVDFKKDKGLAFPHQLKVKSEKLNVIITEKYKETHVDQPVYNRSICSIILEGNPIQKKIESNAFVEYYEFSPIITGLLRKMIKKQYQGWLVD